MKRYYTIFLLFIICAESYSQQYSIEQYLNIRGAGSPQYSHDDKRIYFTMNVTGTNQVWMTDKPGSWPTQVTFFQDRVSGYYCNPEKDLILVEKDEGGSEYNQFYLISGDGTTSEKITGVKPKVLYGFGSWSDDGTFFTYYSNERSPYFYDIFTYDVSKKSRTMVFSSDHSNYPSVISPDGKSLVIKRSYSSSDDDLYLLDLKTNTSELITTHDNFNEPAEFSGVSFDAEGDKIYYISNNNSDFYRLNVYNIESKETENVKIPLLRENKSHDVSSAVFSGNKTKMAVIINDEGYDRLFVFDFNKNAEISIPSQLKSTSITALRFSNDSRKLIVGINSASNPSVLYQWDLGSNNVDKITNPTLAGINPESFVEPALIKYPSFDGLEVPAFIYMPKVKESKKVPCIISIHGGPEGQATYGFAPIYQYFLNSGYAIAEPNVRGSTGYGKKYASMDDVKNRENSVKDIAYLVEYLKSRGDIDPGKIAVYGGSYGGYMVLARLTLYPELFSAGVYIVGIGNFVSFMQNTADYRRKNRESEYGSLENDYDFLQSISPITKVDKIKAPLMIIHGRNDPRVPVGEAEQMYKAITERGGTAEILIYEDEGHGIAKLKNRLDAYPKMVRFLDKYVRDYPGN